MRRTAAGVLVVAAMAAGGLAGGSTSLAVPGDSLTVVTVPGVPAGTAALLVQFAMVDGTAPGYITAGPCSQLQRGPQSRANGNHGVGGSVANLAVIGVDPDGNFCVANNAPVDVVADVQGAFVDGTGDRFVPEAGRRLLDTRDRAAAPPEGGAIEVVDTGAPAGTAAVLVNIAMVDALAAGYITADRCTILVAGPQAKANGNHPAGAAVSNLAIVPVDADGRFCIYHHSPVHLVVDLQGRFAPAAADASAVGFAPSARGRVLDTRDGSSTPPGAGTIEVVDSGAPAGSAAVLVNIAMVDALAPGYVTADRCVDLVAGPQARASGNHGVGPAVSNLAVVPVDTDGRFCIYHQSPVHLVVDVQGHFASDASAGYVALAANRVLDTRPPAPEPSEPATTAVPTGPATPTGAPRTSCASVVHIGDSTSVGMISSSLLPNPADRMPAQYVRVGVVAPRMEISGARSTLETLPGQENAYQVAQRLVAAGYHGCWVFALGTTDTANVAAGASPGRDWRIARMLALVGNDPVLWVNVATIETSGPWSNQQMQLWNSALRAAAPSHPNMVIYDWASVAQRGWFSADRVHYSSDGYRLRGALIANALAAAFPA